jgi:hypothetical protein
MASRSSGRLASLVISRIASGSSRLTDHVTNAQHSRSAATSAPSSLAPSASTRQRISNLCARRCERGRDRSAKARQRRNRAAPSSAPRVHASGNSTGPLASSRSTKTASQEQTADTFARRAWGPRCGGGRWRRFWRCERLLGCQRVIAWRVWLASLSVSDGFDLTVLSDVELKRRIQQAVNEPPADVAVDQHELDAMRSELVQRIRSRHDPQDNPGGDDEPGVREPKRPAPQAGTDAIQLPTTDNA